MFVRPPNQEKVYFGIIIAAPIEHETYDQDIVMTKGIMRVVGLHFTSEMVDGGGPKQLNR